MPSVDQNCFSEVLMAEETPVELVAFQIIEFGKIQLRQNAGFALDKKLMGSLRWLQAVTGSPRVEEPGRRLMHGFQWLEVNGFLVEEPWELHSNSR